MTYQNLFEALQSVCGFTALESDMFEIIAAYEKDIAGLSVNAEETIAPNPTFDKSGYPTDETLEIIEKWSIKNGEFKTKSLIGLSDGLLRYMQAAWDQSMGEAKEVGKGIFVFYDGGWSGNESVMSAFMNNFIMRSVVERIKSNFTVDILAVQTKKNKEIMEGIKDKMRGLLHKELQKVK